MELYGGNIFSSLLPSPPKKKQKTEKQTNKNTPQKQQSSRSVNIRRRETVNVFALFIFLDSWLHESRK